MDSNVGNPTPKFAVDQEVQIISGTYSGKTGAIDHYTLKGVYTYFVLVESLETIIGFKESELISV